MKVANNKNVALNVLLAEAAALKSLAENFDEAAFEIAADLILKSSGYCIVTGMGKSGHIGKKLAATLASTGTPAFFLHPSEASHGDLGMIRPDSVLLALSNSGENFEIKPVLAYCKANAIPVIAITARPQSSLGSAASVVLGLSDVDEACPNGLAPTTSTTMTLALGDALAIMVMSARQFSPSDFGKCHPGGKLGMQLQTVAEWMNDHRCDCPTLPKDAGAKEVISAITEARAGCTGVVDDSGALVGIITDGDLRRALEGDIFAQSASELMTGGPVTVTPSITMGRVVELMSDKRIGNIYVVEENLPKALINLKDLVEMGYV